MNIGDVAKQIGMPAKTIRYYEDLGLVEPRRSQNGYRIYAADTIHKLAFIGRARSFGFSVADCRALLSLYEDKSRSSADVKKLALQNLAQIDQKLEELTAMRNSVAHLIQCCAGDARPECPILSDLAGNA